MFGSLPILSDWLTTFAVSLVPWQPFFGGSTSINQISGKIKCGEEVLASLTGHWVTFDNQSCWQVTSPWLQGLREDLAAHGRIWNAHWPLPASPRACRCTEPGPHLSRYLWKSFTLISSYVCSGSNTALPEPGEAGSSRGPLYQSKWFWIYGLTLRTSPDGRRYSVY